MVTSGKTFNVKQTPKLGYVNANQTSCTFLQSFSKNVFELEKDMGKSGEKMGHNISKIIRNHFMHCSFVTELFCLFQL